MRKRWALVAAVVAGLTVAFLPSASLAIDQPATPDSLCGDCCSDGSDLCAALAALAELRTAVVELVPDPGLANSLEVKVDASTMSVLALRPSTALNQLGEFDDELTAADKSNRIPHNDIQILKTMDQATVGLIQG